MYSLTKIRTKYQRSKKVNTERHKPEADAGNKERERAIEGETDNGCYGDRNR